MKKLYRGWLGVLLALTLIFPASLIAIENDRVEAVEINETELDVSRTTFSLTEKRTVEVQADLGANVNLDNLEFEFGGKDLSEWKKWSGGNNYEGEPFINVIEEPSFIDERTEMKTTIELGVLYDTTDISIRKVRTQYHRFNGDYKLGIIKTESGKKAEATVKLNIYDEFLFYD